MAASGTKAADSVVLLTMARTALVAAPREGMDLVDLEVDQEDSVRLEAALVGMALRVVDSVAAEDFAGNSSAKALVGMMTGTSSVRATRLLSRSRFWYLLPGTDVCNALAVLVGPVVCCCSVLPVHALSSLLSLPDRLLA